MNQYREYNFEWKSQLLESTYLLFDRHKIEKMAESIFGVNI